MSHALASRDMAGSDSLRSGLLKPHAVPHASAQLRALLWKQGIVYRRSWCTPLLFVCLVPLLALLSGLLAATTTAVGDNDALSASLSPITVGSGVAAGFDSRLSAGERIRYAPSAAAGATGATAAAADAIMAALAAGSGGALVVGLSPAGNTHGYRDAASMAEAVVAGLAPRSAAGGGGDHYSPTWAAVHFTTNGSAVHYTVGVNSTETYQGAWARGNLREKLHSPGTPRGLANVGLQLALDAAVAAAMSPPGQVSKTSAFTLTLSSFVDVVPSTIGLAEWAMASRLVSFAVVGGIAWCSMLAMRGVSKEKVAGLVASMRFMGLQEGVYWISWHGPILLASVVACVLVPAVGMITGLSAFANTSYFVWFGILLPSMLSNIALGLALVAGTTTRCVATVSAIAFLFLSVVVHGMFVGIDAADSSRLASSYGPSSWDNVYAPATSIIFKILCQFLPMFHFGKSWDDILKHAGPQPSGLAANGTLPYTNSDWWSSNEFATNGEHWSSPSTAASVFILWALYILYSLVAWHRGRPALGESSTCKSRVAHECVCLTPTAWKACCRRCRGKKGQRPRSSRPSSLSASRRRSGSSGRPLSGGLSLRSLQSAMEKEEAAMEQEEMDAVTAAQAESRRDGSIKLHKLTKAYNTGTAVKELSLTMNAGEVFCLLGHNGAGKSTTFKMLSGQTTPTFGDAFLMGHDIRSDLMAVQRMLGVCPQHDVLFEELSAEQHLWFWGLFKGVPASGGQLKAEVQSLLAETQLEQKRHAPVSTCSGGQRRRVSLGNAAIGSAPILFLDEPTTGMDVVVRRVVWNMVQRRKEEGAIVVLTTHSMEEADMLSDRIAILANGQLRAEGTSLFLKNRFGAGYNISIECKAKDQAEVEAMIKRLLHGADIVSPVPGTLTVALPRRCMRALPGFFRECEAGTGGVQSFAVSNTTLEEVFIRLTASTHTVNAALAGVGAGDGPALCVLCEKRPTELCTLLTRTGKEVKTADLVCAVCADGVAESAALALDDLDGAEAKAEGSATGLEAGAGAAGVGAGRGGTDSASVMVAVSGGSGASPEADHRAHARSPPLSWATIRPLYRMHQTTFCGQCCSREARKAHFRLSEEERKKQPCAPWWLFFFLSIILILPGALVVGITASGRHSTYPWTTTTRSKNNQIELFRLSHGHTETCKDASGTMLYRWYEKLGAPNGWCNGPALPSVIARQLTNCSANGHAAGGGSEFDCMHSSSWADVSTVSPTRPTRVWLDTTAGVSTLPWSGGNDVVFVSLPAGESAGGSFRKSAAWVRSNTKSIGGLTCTLLKDETDRGWSDSSWSLTAPSAEAAMTTFDAVVPDIGVQVNQADSVASAGGASLQLGLNVTAFVSADNMTSSHYSLLSVFYSSNATADQTPTGPACRSVQLVREVPLRGLLAMARRSSDAMLRKAHVPASVTSTWFRLPSPDYTFWQREDGTPFASGITLAVTASATSLVLFPYLVYNLVSARESGMLSVMKMQGVTDQAYAVATMLFYGNMAMWLSITALFVSFIILPLLAPWHPRMLALWVSAVFAPWTSIGAAMLASTLFTTARNALLASFLGGFILVGGGGVLSVFVSWPWLVTLVCPPLAYARTTFLATMGDEAVSSELMASLITLFVGGVVYMVAGVGVIAGWCRPGGLVRSMCSRRGSDEGGFGVGDEVRAGVGGGAGAGAGAGAASEAAVRVGWGSDRHPSSPTPTSSDPYSGAQDEGDEDEDVVAERAATLAEPNTLKNRHSHAIKLVDVRKKYPGRDGQPPVDAVRGVTLRCEYGECFGLLGPNGAGKTTLISMLAGEEPITGGHAYVGGYDCTTEINGVRRALGVVPQFDALWLHLTSRQHLLLFGELAGLRGVALRNAVSRVATDLELDGDSFDRPAKSLSGGQRRRLALGCAIVGNNKILFLDEPTTGLDPETRQEIWGVINKLRTSQRCIVLTTHSMEEAQALCTRIGIIAGGRLRCVGTTLHLRQKYTGSFRLKLNITPGAEERACAFVREHVSPAARLKRSFRTSRLFELPRDIHVSAVFDSMRDGAKRAGIAEWSLSQGSLEAVFVRVVSKAQGSE